MPKLTRTTSDLTFLETAEKCSAEVLPLFGTSDHLLITVKFDAKQNVSTEVPFHRMIFQHDNTNWDSFRTYTAVASPFNFFFKNKSSRIASLISE